MPIKEADSLCYCGDSIVVISIIIFFNFNFSLFQNSQAKWYWSDDGDKWVVYDDVTCNKIEKAYHKKQKTVKVRLANHEFHSFTHLVSADRRRPLFGPSKYGSEEV